LGGCVCKMWHLPCSWHRGTSGVHIWREREWRIERRHSWREGHAGWEGHAGGQGHARGKGHAGGKGHARGEGHAGREGHAGGEGHSSERVQSRRQRHAGGEGGYPSERLLRNWHGGPCARPLLRQRREGRAPTNQILCARRFNQLACLFWAQRLQHPLRVRQDVRRRDGHPQRPCGRRDAACVAPLSSGGC
jgi:hypothetical protein